MLVANITPTADPAGGAQLRRRDAWAPGAATFSTVHVRGDGVREETARMTRA